MQFAPKSPFDQAHPRDLVVLFAGTGQEPDHPGGQTVCWNLGYAFDATVLYQPGIGTWETHFSKSAQGIGYGALGLVDDMLDRLAHYAGYRVSAFGESRGADMAWEFAQGYEKRTGGPLHLYGAIDSVSALGWDAIKRIAPRRWWHRPTKARPPAIHAFHLIAGLEPKRFYVHDVIADVDAEVLFPGLRHGEIIRSADALAACVQFAEDVGLRKRHLDPLEAAA